MFVATLFDKTLFHFIMIITTLISVFLVVNRNTSRRRQVGEMPFAFIPDFKYTELQTVNVSFRLGVQINTILLYRFDGQHKEKMVHAVNHFLMEQERFHWTYNISLNHFLASVISPARETFQQV